ncbi:MAG: glutamate synthase [Clostridiales bacterium]|nr:glutamate synthase [Clostridiales bacterium]
MRILAGNMHFKTLNEKLRAADEEEILIERCLGQRYIGAGASGKRITIEGVPGNALGAYLNGSHITVKGNAQDATGDTMNEGTICIHGMAGDATGYAMRGGAIYIQDGTGYRAGIHMKAYEEKRPLLVIGGEAGSFLGEYQAGGDIIVLGLGAEDRPPVGGFCGAGMHGGRIFLRTERLPPDLSDRLTCRRAGEGDMADIRPALERYAREFGVEMEEILAKPFYLIQPDSRNPYKQLYTAN